MSLSETSIRRPVLAIVMSLIIVLFGLMSFYFLGVCEFPAVVPPIVTVSTTYPGANPDVVASQITEPLEQVINGIAGIRTHSSESRQEAQHHHRRVHARFGSGHSGQRCARPGGASGAKLAGGCESLGRGKGGRGLLADSFSITHKRLAGRARRQRFRGPSGARANGNHPRRFVG